MDSSESIQRCIEWLSYADYHSENTVFGAVSAAYRRKYLSDGEFDVDTRYYFDHCIPRKPYCACSRWPEDFDMCNNEGLLYCAEQMYYSEYLVPLGFALIAVSQGGDPLLLDKKSCRLHFFPPGMLCEQGICSYDCDAERDEVFELTKDNVVRFSTYSFDGIARFLAEAVEERRRQEVYGIWEALPLLDLPYFKHLTSLGFNLDIRNEAGLGPAEEAERLGRRDVAMVLRTYIEECRRQN